MSVSPAAVFTGEYDCSVQEPKDRTGLQAESHHCVGIFSKDKFIGLEQRQQSRAILRI